MKLKDLINEFDASGFVFQDQGSGSRTDRGEFVRLDDKLIDKYGDVEMSELDGEHVSDDGLVCNYASEWIDESDCYGQLKVRLLF